MDGIERYFPAGTRLNAPQGGYVLWVELPPQADTVALMETAAQENISLAPGALFSAREGFASSMRLSCGAPWTAAQDQALRRLGELVDAHLQMA